MRPTFTRSIRILLATSALAATAIVLPAAPPAQAGGLRNCVDVTGAQINRVGCWEDVWADGRQVRMTFSNTQFTGSTPRDLAPFYVLAPQGDVIQGTAPFAHDHVIDGVPADNGGTYGVRMATYFVMCSADGIVSGACIPTMSHVEGIGDLPLARTVDGHALTSTERIEAAADAGSVQLFDIGAVIVGSVASR
jgi:hypothetical protein